MSNERSNRKLNRTKSLTVSLATSSALALVLSVGPVPYDADQGVFSYPVAHAKSCFLPGTQVRMADGRLKSIESVLEGEWVMGLNGRPNQVVGIERVALGGRRLYGFNGSPAFVTAEHPFWTPSGWKSIDPAMTTDENPDLAVRTLGAGDEVAVWADATSVTNGNTALDTDVVGALRYVTLQRIEAFEASAETIVYNLLLDGDHTYFADGYVVHNKGGEGGEGGDGGDGGGSEGGEGGDGGGSEGGEGGDGGGSEGGEGGDGGGSEGGEGGDGGGSEGGEGGDGGGSEGGEGGDGGGSEGGEGGDGGGSEGGEGGEGGDGSGSEGGESGEGGDDGSESGEGGESGDDSDDGAEANDDASEQGEQGRGRGRGRGRGEHVSDAEQGERGRSAPGLAGDVSSEGGGLSAAEEAAAIASGWSQ